VRVRGSIAERELIGDKDRRAKFVVTVDLVASKPAPSLAASVRHPGLQLRSFGNVEGLATR
jgi:hypothetical protein